MAHNVFTGNKREQSRLVFNGPVGCLRNWQGLTYGLFSYQDCFVEFFLNSPINSSSPQFG